MIISPTEKFNVKRKKLTVDGQSGWMYVFNGKIGTQPFGLIVSYEKPSIGKNLIVVLEKNKHLLKDIYEENPGFVVDSAAWLIKIHTVYDYGNGHISVFADLM
jgi:hypothetical protein